MAASGPVRTPSGDPPDVLAALRSDALELSRLLLSLDPVLGEPRLQRATDAFVEQAADALRALARYAADAGYGFGAGTPAGTGGGGDREGTGGWTGGWTAEARTRHTGWSEERW